MCLKPLPGFARLEGDVPRPEFAMTSSGPDSSVSPAISPTELPADVRAVAPATRLRNFLVVLVAVGLSVAIFLGVNTQSGPVSLGALAKAAVPLDVALSNGKPTLIEFYANWCTSCQAMAKDMQSLKGTYGDRVNFVMLNVDNTKWLPEILTYRVDGIPHFVFMGTDGKAQAEAIGEQPQAVMAANLVALAEQAPLPYAQATGQTSEFSPPVSTKGATDPRSHGNSVVANPG
jgi:thiol-disulfide isomerase/thioredoxin